MIHFLIADIGTYTNKDVFEYFNFTPPLIAGDNNNNSSTDAVADAYQDDRDDMEMGYDFGNDIQVSSFGPDPKNSLNDGFIANEANQVPPEYADDPDLWYTIQASLKVTFSEYHFSRSTLINKMKQWMLMIK